MKQISDKNELRMQKQTTIKDIWNRDGQINHYSIKKKLDR